MKTKTPMLIAGISACLLASCLIMPTAAAQSLWDDDGPNANLIADNVAKKKGDIITIIIKESQKVEDKQEVKLEQDSTLDSVLESFNISSNTFNPLPDFIQETTKDFEGKSDYNKENAFEARITAQVIDVMPNGNLVIEGNRNIFMDDEEKKIKITGTVRPLDVTPDNTVLSSKVCDARVSYDGEGTLSRNTEKGWLDTILDFIWPF